MDSVAVNFINKRNNTSSEIEIPLNIRANDLIYALNEAFLLNMDINNLFDCYLVSENPIALLKGNKTLKEYRIRNGSNIIFTR